MALKLNQRGYDHARSLVEDGKAALDDRDAWSEHRPSTAQENEFIKAKGWGEYARWHLGIDDEHNERTKARYKFPHGDFEQVHRCAVLSAEVRAAQRDYTEIQLAAAHLHGMLDELMRKAAQRR
jgi:hypothetical protein